MSNSNLNVMALDDGYGDIKHDNGEFPSLFPSFITPYKPKPKDVFSNSSSQDLQYIASEVDGIKYVVGDYAMKLDPDIRWVGGENKHKDSRFPILFKTALGLMSMSNMEVIDVLMLNLPIRYDTTERRRYLEQIARGVHEVGISFDGEQFLRKTIAVESVEIKKQPFGSLCEVILDDDGDIINTDLAKGFNVIVDIGSRTLNVMSLEALEEQPELTTQTNDGMYSAYSQIGSFLEDKLGVIIPDGKLPQIIRDKEIKNKDITPLIEKVYGNHANIIMSTLDKLLISSWGFITSIIFTGGGSEVLRPYLDSAFRDVDTIFLDRYSNVKGLRKYGVRQARRKQGTTNVGIRMGNNGHKQ